MSGPALRFRFLLVVVEAARDGVMGIVDLGHEVGDRELKLVHPQLPPFGLRRQSQPWTEVVQDVGRLCKHQITGFQKWGRERGPLPISVFQEPDHRVHTPAAARQTGHVDIVRTSSLEGQAHELAAALYSRPVVELVAHEASGGVHKEVSCRCNRARYSQGFRGQLTASIGRCSTLAHQNSPSVPFTSGWALRQSRSLARNARNQGLSPSIFARRNRS